MSLIIFFRGKTRLPVKYRIHVAIAFLLLGQQYVLLVTILLGRSDEVVHGSILLKYSVSQFPFVYGLYTDSLITFIGVNTLHIVLNLELVCRLKLGHSYREVCLLCYKPTMLFDVQPRG